ncbi:adenylate/guanylate cyclase domain-containing protein [Nocardioides marmorisolisilvae]|uniref:Adenylate/guanylate cyclase domain-containing protein n=1 Tax=Nocardioides marmorisolisilvae TaxID=1542737 RepID=A0A3N0DVP6_9ACTN|nr:adenylate/guanylate cyclase domain-containing protein [Nocardioides marmorisolisilvae]RNL79685.1 adenylate/guanylate cyclase domain-containing protein [Nocardioides marmorisolisilvae]
MDDRLFHEFLANTVIGGMSIALAAILLARHQTRGDLAMAASWLFAGTLAATTPLVAGQADPAAITVGDRLYVLPLMGLYVSTPIYIRHLVTTAAATDRARQIVIRSAAAGCALGLATYVLALVEPARFLNHFVYALDASDAWTDSEFWLFGAPLTASCAFLLVAWTTLARQDLDPGERSRARVYSVAVAPLLLSLVLPREASIVAYATAFVLFLLGVVTYGVAEGERAAFLSRFLSPQVTEMVRLRGLNAVMQAQELTLSVIFIDFRGFTAYTEAIPSQAVIELLRDYHEAIAGCVGRHDGMINNYAGDGIMILVGAPIARDDHERAAVALAEDAQRAAARVTGRWATDLHPLGVGIGIASGRVTVGAIGEIAQMEYAAVGTAVNLAARLCAQAEAGAILLDERVAVALGEGRTLPRGEIALKGLSAPVPVYQVRSDSEPRAVAGEPLA